MFFKANQHGLSHEALYPLSVLDFSNVNMADAHVTAIWRSKVPTEVSLLVILCFCYAPYQYY